MIKCIHRDCGAIVRKEDEKCWYCNQSLDDNNIIAIDRKEPVIAKSKYEKSNDNIATPTPQKEYSFVPNQQNTSWDFEDIYENGRMATGILVFVISYIYCIASYGFLFGLGLGWIPSLIVAFVASIIWPLIAVLVIVFIVIILIAFSK